MGSKLPKRLKRYLSILLVALVSGCAVYQAPPVTRIALLAPFEGRYREVGYQALYAARLALAETGRIDLELLAVDDGGSIETAVDRAHALNHDPLVEAVLVLGVHAADARVLDVLQPYTLVVGDWSAVEITGAETSREPPREITEIAALDVEFVCGDICLLPAYPALADDPTLATIQVSSPPVDDAFRERYINSDLYVPPPLPFAGQAYTATQHIIDRVTGQNTANTPPTLATETFTYRYTAEGELITP